MSPALLRLLLPLALLALVGCGSPECFDPDGDDFGAGCGEPDCDDTNPLRNVDCDAVPAPDCVANPTATGCPCIASAVAPCYSGPDGTEGVGLCQGGVVRCQNGFYGLCQGEVVPTFERCDGLDQSCDGRADEGVSSPCGGCDVSCIGGVWGEGPQPFVAEPGFALTGPGFLTLARNERTHDDIWVANTDEDTVTRIDATLGMAVARHASGGSGPSRVAVDWRGDVFVLNRAFGGVSTLTKIAGDISRCVDRDMSMSIETSPDADTVPPLVDDECVLFSVPVGGVDDVARAIAVDGARVNFEGTTTGGDVWIGLYGGEAFLHVDGETGTERERIETPGFQPYGATIDPFGALYMVSQDGFLLRASRFDPSGYEITAAPLACYLMYGVDADSDGRLLMGGFSCDQAILHDPFLGTWRTLPTLPSARSLVVEGDVAWLAHADGRASELSLDPFRVSREVDLTGAGAVPIETIGVATDSSGGVWFISSQRDPMSSLGVATRVEASSGTVRDQVTVGLRPHSQGDASGSRLDGEFVPSATTSHVFEGCANGETEWVRLRVVADPGGAGAVDVSYRHAADEAGLSGVSFTPAGTLIGLTVPFPVSLGGLPEGGVLEVQLTLRTDARDGAPRVERVGVEWLCNDFG